MGCLDIQDKLAMMIDSLKIANEMLRGDNLRNKQRIRLEEDVDILKRDIRELYIDLFKIISN